ncbi:MAG: histidinol dehydrogenase [Gammaproteobacteria bacterium]|nr:histidinol dehydrogenase [Gammaproteobacteria bacterium]MYA67781.1 histidinol dehydrogenase [Gammaproteobacteria bacterium]MYH47470.1 histidinol dehydrogenase [Gammaproteobacteria bacterium]MYL12346.1 histidinol dehydrogenase [Gammaproteobacteria bacterium]
MNEPALDIRFLSASQPDFSDRLATALDRQMLVSEQVTEQVRAILDDTRSRGDKAVLEYTRRFDGLDARNMAGLTVERDRMEQSLARLPAASAEAMRHAAERIRRYHEAQKQDSWQYAEDDGSVYGQKVSALERVGIYVPGGKASYPSSVLMLAIPASVAGVREIIATVPLAWGEGNDMVFAAAALAGVDRLYTIGGAQAIGALAYGTETVPKVDKIAGPGNIYVTVAKKLVFGEVGIDMIAGPTELTVICDGGTDPDWIAMDLFSQAEHDEQAQSILIATDADYLEAVAAAMRRHLPDMERRDIIAASINDRALFILVDDLEQAAAVSNRIAPEHLELSVEDPNALLKHIEHAGAIFMGRYSAEVLGDYCAGPSHVLPTSGTARFSSALGVPDFQKRSSIIHCSAAGAATLAITAAELGRNENLYAHARSAEYRLPD